MNYQNNATEIISFNGKEFKKYINSAGKVFFLGDYKRYNYRSEFGTAHFTLECPFCGTQVIAYSWSLAGSGKRCPDCHCLHAGWLTSIMTEEQWNKFIIKT